MNLPETKRDRSWDFNDLTELLYGNVGYEFGKTPEEQMAHIRAAREPFVDWLQKKLDLSKKDIVGDLGSGLGFVAGHMVSRVGKLHCMDISLPFLEHCKKQVEGRGDAEFHLIPFADLSCLADKGVNKIYSTAVFIHFNIYDVFLYLQECAKVLKPGGMVAFDFANADALDPDGPEWGDHVKLYKSDRSRIGHCMNYHSLSGIDRVLKLTGFKRIRKYIWPRSIFVVCERR